MDGVRAGVGLRTHVRAPCHACDTHACTPKRTHVLNHLCWLLVATALELMGIDYHFKCSGAAGIHRTALPNAGVIDTPICREVPIGTIRQVHCNN
jgi:hypothetical protein